MFNSLFKYCAEVKHFSLACSSDIRSGGATPGRARLNDLAGRSTALAQALATPCLALRIALLR